MDELTCLSVHPGTVGTDMVNNILQQPGSDLNLVNLFKKCSKIKKF